MEWADDVKEFPGVKEEKEEKQPVGASSSWFSEAGEKRRETAKFPLSKEFAGISGLDDKSHGCKQKFEELMIRGRKEFDDTKTGGNYLSSWPKSIKRWFMDLLSNIKEEHPSEDDEISEILKGIRRFTFEEIKDATNDFDDQNIIRETNDGVMYRGSLGAPIAVQMDIFKEYRWENYQELKNKIYFLSRLNHPNITRLFGYCIHNGLFMLIYEYTWNGSLDRLLIYNREKQLQLYWERRYNICLGIAKGLIAKGLSHFRVPWGGIETASIYLDENFNPKICFYDLLIAHNTKQTFRKYNFSDYRQYDIYCYGAVILELVSGDRFEKNGAQFYETQNERGNLLKFVDPRLGSAYSEEQALLLLKLSGLCMNFKNQPSIITVLGVLEGKQKFEELNQNLFEDKVISRLDHSSSSKKAESVTPMPRDEPFHPNIKDEHPSEDDEISEILKGIRRFTFEEIKDATNDFDDQNIIRETNDGVMYRGLLSEPIAVQRIFFIYSRREDYQVFKNKIYFLSRLNHPNITRLFGYCIHNKEFMLIYEYTCNASFLCYNGEKQLQLYNGRKQLQLDWERRYNICLGIAKGLAYFHINSRQGAAGGGIKTANIFLDENFNPKMWSFHLISAYKTFLMPRDYRYGKKVDIDVYGIVILELVSGNSFDVYGNNLFKFSETQKERGNLLKFVDPRLGSAYSEEQALLLLKLSGLCMYFKNQPSIITVLGVLEGKQEFEELNRNQLEDKGVTGLDYSSSSKTETGAEISSEQRILDEVDFILSKRGIHEFTFREIDLATTNFTDRIQGCANVYLGILSRGVLPDGHQIAVKRFLTSSNITVSELRSEIFPFDDSRHPNIARILGLCGERHVGVMLIYEFMQNRTLSHFLCQEERLLELDMTRRFEICLGVAKGLAYLLQNNFIHGDIKPMNILLDEDFNPKIINLSPTKSMREDMTYVTKKGVGAFGYLDLEYLQSGKITKEGDVYCYGVVVLELVSGKRFFEVNVCQLHECLNKQGNLLQFVDPRLIDSDDSRGKALMLLKLSASCTEREPKLRPSITQVVRILEGKQFDQEIPNRKDKYVEFTDDKERMGSHLDPPPLPFLWIFQLFGNLLSKRGIHEFPFHEIDLATKKSTDRIQGCANVYLGRLPDRRQIAVKRFLASSEVPVWELGSEILAFIGSRHPNIANILGFCREGRVELMLIYEFMQDRTLSHFIRQEERLLKLDMTTRYEICLGVAKGLAYLLDDDFIHGDIKPMNILLDEDFNPKIMNLSPSKRMRKDMTYVTTKGVGALTFGYLDPSYLQSGKFTEEGDVYSYGVVVLELVSGKRFFEVNVCQLHECLNKQGNLLQFVDPRLIDTDDSRGKALMLLKLSASCTEREPKLRPSITQVVRILEGGINNMDPSKEKVIQENPTTEICSHEAFEKLRDLVLSNSLEEALKEKIKIEIFRLCKILDGSTFLPEARSGLAHRVKDFLSFTSQLSIVCKEDSSYDEDSQLASLDEKMERLNLQNPVASDSNDIIQLAKSLMESRKVAAKRRLIHSKKCFDKGKEDWKFIQTRFK